MSSGELQRVRVLQQVIDGNLTLVRASELMKVSYRHAKRLKAEFIRHGPHGLAHRNRGKPPPNKISSTLRDKIIELSSDKYAAFNDTHFTEKLSEVEGIEISRETVRRIRRNHGFKPKRKRKPPRHHSRREREPAAGLLTQWDASKHRWFGPDKPFACLHSVIDDATGDLLAARFEPQECAAGYLKLLHCLVTKHGVPAAAYRDRHTIFQRNDKHWTLEEELAGRRFSTQFGMALDDFGIKSIAAYSPQAKGRVERSYGTLQDRMVAELALAGIDEIEAANHWLEDFFIADYNKRFGIPARDKRKVFGKLNGHKPDMICSFRYRATVGNDNAVRIGELIIDVPPGPRGRSYAKAKAEARQLLDGSWRVIYNDKIIAKHQPTPLREIKGIKSKRF